MENEECIVCTELLGTDTITLPCGHIFHTVCVQRSSDTLQDTRTRDGFPPLECCICPLCRTPVPDMPVAPPSEPTYPELEFEYSLSVDDLQKVVDRFIAKDPVQHYNNYTGMIEEYIYDETLLKYPDIDTESLVLMVAIYGTAVRMGQLVKVPDVRFQRILETEW